MSYHEGCDDEGGSALIQHLSWVVVKVVVHQGNAHGTWLIWDVQAEAQWWRQWWSWLKKSVHHNMAVPCCTCVSTKVVGMLLDIKSAEILGHERGTYPVAAIAFLDSR